MKRLSPIDRRLAASWHQRHIEIVAKADAIARAVGQRVDRAGKAIIGIAATGRMDAATFHAIRKIWAAVIPELVLYLDPVMRSMVRYSDRDAKDRLAQLVPRGWWRIRFPSMREWVMEHLPGEHDQKKHGRFKGGGKQTESEAFKKWFGKSKVVDEHGKPLVVYHGTASAFKSFSDERIGSNTDVGRVGAGYYFTSDKNIASSYSTMARGTSQSIIPVYLKIESPLHLRRAEGQDMNDAAEQLAKSIGVTANPEWDGNKPTNPDYALQFRRRAEALGHDGVITHFSDGSREFSVFRPEHIKSATGNRGTFDPSSDDITEAGPARGDAFDRLFGPGAFVAGAEPALRGQGTLSDEEYQRLVRQTILPPLMESDVEAIVKSPNPHTGDSWQKRLTDLSGKVKSPDALAGEIVTGIANGENIQQLRDRVDVQVGKLNGSAQRIARTEARRVAEMANRKSWESLGELLDGAQIIAVLDERTRPKHAARNGTIYRIGGVPRFEDLPILPDEPNCRCTAAPVLKTPSEVANDPKLAAEFKNEKDQHIPDPAAYDQWFRQADEPRRRQAVGSGRYDVVKRRLQPTGEQPEWKDFIKPDGSLVPVQTLKRESAAVASERKLEVGVMLAQREDLFRQIALRPFTIAPTAAEIITTGMARQRILDAGAKIALALPKTTKQLTALAKAEAAAIAAEYHDIDKAEVLADVFLAYTLAMQQRRLI